MTHFRPNFFQVYQRLLRRWNFCRIFYFLLEQLFEFVLRCELYIPREQVKAAKVLSLGELSVQQHCSQFWLSGKEKIRNDPVVLNIVEFNKSHCVARVT